MRKSYILIAIGVAALITVAVLVSLQQQTEIVSQEDRIFNLGDRTSEPEDRTLIRTILEVSGLSYEIFVPEGSTVYDLMVAAASQHNDFSFNGREFSGLGFFVEEINGLSQNQREGKYWIYYVNGESAPVGISQYKVKANDVITWKYEKEH